MEEPEEHNNRSKARVKILRTFQKSQSQGYKNIEQNSVTSKDADTNPVPVSIGR
jgi:hypothetical protein